MVYHLFSQNFNQVNSTSSTALSTANTAKSIADAAKSTAATARSTASAAQATANAAMPSTGGTFTGSVSVKGGVEIYDISPHIDFHRGNSSADYSARIIEDAPGSLYFYGKTDGNTIKQYSSRGNMGNVVSCEGYPITLAWTGSALDAYVQNNRIGRVQLG